MKMNMNADATTTQGRFAGILENYCDTALLCQASKLQDDTLDGSQ